MIYINQLRLMGKGLDKNKDFFKEIYATEDFIDSKRWFDVLDGTMDRKLDENMTLDKYLNLFDRNAITTLQLASPRPDEIRYLVSDNINGIIHYAFIEMPYNELNFDIIAKSYQDAFGKRLEDEPTAKGLVEYYKRLTNNI
jgi:hypothetical protein